MRAVDDDKRERNGSCHAPRGYAVGGWSVAVVVVVPMRLSVLGCAHCVPCSVRQDGCDVRERRCRRSGGSVTTKDSAANTDEGIEATGIRNSST